MPKTPMIIMTAANGFVHAELGNVSEAVLQPYRSVLLSRFGGVLWDLHNSRIKQNNVYFITLNSATTAP